MHVVDSGAIAGLLMLAIQRYCNSHLIELPPLLIGIIVSGGTLCAGTIWEMFEFTVDRTGLFNAQRGLHDTMLDLMADAGGRIVSVAALMIANIPGMRCKVQKS